MRKGRGRERERKREEAREARKHERWKLGGNKE